MQALYRGNGANVARLVPDVALKFAVHDQLRLMFTPPDGSPPGVAEKAAAGAATGVVVRMRVKYMRVCFCVRACLSI
jgi:solute carrier family 25 (mitochondrial adenine nucleotide translocator), member 4/5/6/31